MKFKDQITSILTERIDYPLAENQLDILVNVWLKERFGDEIKTTAIENGGVTIMKKVPGKTKFREIAKIKVGPENMFYVSDRRIDAAPKDAENIPAVKNILADILASQEIKEL